MLYYCANRADKNDTSSNKEEIESEKIKKILENENLGSKTFQNLLDKFNDNLLLKNIIENYKIESLFEKANKEHNKKEINNEYILKRLELIYKIFKTTEKIQNILIYFFLIFLILFFFLKLFLGKEKAFEYVPFITKALLILLVILLLLKKHDIKTNSIVITFNLVLLIIFLALFSYLIWSQENLLKIIKIKKFLFFYLTLILILITQILLQSDKFLPYVVIFFILNVIFLIFFSTKDNFINRIFSFSFLMFFLFTSIFLSIIFLQNLQSNIFDTLEAGLQIN